MIAKCGTVIIGYGGMGGWHTQQLSLIHISWLKSTVGSTP